MAYRTLPKQLSDSFMTTIQAEQEYGVSRQTIGVKAEHFRNNKITRSQYFEDIEPGSKEDAFLLQPYRLVGSTNYYLKADLELVFNTFKPVDLPAETQRLSA